MSDTREKLWKASGMILGAAVSWPAVSKYLGTLPDFAQSELWGTGAGFIFGLFLFSSRVVQKLASAWHNAWKVLAFLLIAGSWVYLNWKLPLLYEANLEKPNVTAERVRSAKFAVTALAFLWSVPLTYIGGLLGDAIARKADSRRS